MLGWSMSFPPAPHPLPEPLIELVAQRFRVLGEPMRIRLLDQLCEADATVGELQQALGASQQNVSKHLGILHAAGMVQPDQGRQPHPLRDQRPQRVRALRPRLRRHPPPAPRTRSNPATQLERPAMTMTATAHVSVNDGGILSLRPYSSDSSAPAAGGGNNCSHFADPEHAVSVIDLQTGIVNSPKVSSSPNPCNVRPDSGRQATDSPAWSMTWV